MLLVWRGQSSAQGIERSRELFDPWAEELGRPVSFLIVTQPAQRVPPDAATRAAMQRAMSKVSSQLMGMATLIEDEGFVAASIRAVMTRLHSSGDVAPKFLRTTDEAAAWARELLQDPELSRSGLEQAIRLAREG
jgi:hypothetical protein